MPLTKDQLLLDRVKVVLDYPDSIYKIGDIIVYSREVAQSYDEWHNERTGEKFFKNPGFFKKYPNIFQPLPWWSDRKTEDMPQYYKHTGNHGIFKTNFRPQGGIVMLQFSPTETVPTGLEYTLPATEEEYTAYINQKQQ